MALPPVALLLALSTIALGLGFTYFGHAVVTRLTSMAGGLAGSFVGIVAAQALATPAHGAGSLSHVLLTLVGALIGGFLGSTIARSTQRLGIATLAAAVAGAITYTTAPSWWPGQLSVGSFGVGLATPLAAGVVTGIVIGALTLRFYRPLLGIATSLVGATILQFAARHWSHLLPVLHPETWTTLGANPLVWTIVVASGVLVQYRRHRAVRANVVRMRPSAQRTS